MLGLVPVATHRVTNPATAELIRAAIGQVLLNRQAPDAYAAALVTLVRERSGRRLRPRRRPPAGQAPCQADRRRKPGRSRRQLHRGRGDGRDHGCGSRLLDCPSHAGNVKRGHACSDAAALKQCLDTVVNLDLLQIPVLVRWSAPGTAPNSWLDGEPPRRSGNGVDSADPPRSAAGPMPHDRAEFADFHEPGFATLVETTRGRSMRNRSSIAGMVLPHRGPGTRSGAAPAASVARRPRARTTADAGRRRRPHCTRWPKVRP